MATEARTRLTLDFDVAERTTGVGINNRTVNFRHRIQRAKQYDNGTGADQADLPWSDEGSVTAGAPVSLDLAGGLTLLTSGATITWVEITHVYVRHTGGTGNLAIGGGSNAWGGMFADATDGISIGPGGEHYWSSPTNGATVTPGTADLLRLASTSGVVTYEVIIVGRSA